MRLSFNEIRARAANFAREWAGKGYEKGETQTFYNEFFDVFGISRKRVASFEAPVKKLGQKQGFMDLFWPGMLLVEQKSLGRDLTKAKTQAFEYFPNLKETELPRFILVSDFQSFELHELQTGVITRFNLADLPQNVEAFGFIIGVQRRAFKDQDPVNIQAAELMGALHDALRASGYDGRKLERFLVRLVFCLFADDTGIFEPRDLFNDFLQTRARDDGSDLGPWLAKIFQTLNTPEARRSAKLDEDLARFPYINGDLFGETLEIPDFDAPMRALLLDACRFDWSAISPAIFGSLFQSVMSATQRRTSGAHYTTEKNILKTIGPLFLDDLRAEFEHLKGLKSGREARLRAFHDKLASLTFLDPACGAGNFLVIAYRELRQLEIELLLEITASERNASGYFSGQLDVSGLSRLEVSRFYGIEIGDFAAHIAETALWMMDHIMNNRLSLAFGHSYLRIPLKKSPHILCADALEVDWAALLPPDQAIYVMGNPPFIGAKFQTDAQRAQVRRIAALGGSGGTLDYVAAWFLKGADYARAGAARIAFVATNSITQGEQAAQLWPLLLDRKRMAISFAHKTFAWGSDARGKAHVHVVIIGLARREDAPETRRLFSYADINADPVESSCRAISPYLFDASALANPATVIHEAAQPLNDFPKLITGTQPLDDGYLIFTDEERADFLTEESGAAPWMRPFIGAEEYINGGQRWILALQKASPSALRALPRVMERLKSVKEFRKKSKRKGTQMISDFPQKYNVEVIPSSPFLVIPQVSSERRAYIPIGWLEPPVIPSDKLRLMEGATPDLFALLTSEMHMSWMRAITGRMKSDYMYSVGVVYNNFPAPDLTAAQTAKLADLGKAILAARANHPGETLAALYDPEAMPPDLRKAHQANDRFVDRLYRPEGFASDAARVAYLFGLYERLTAPMVAAANAKPKRGRKPTI